MDTLTITLQNPINVSVDVGDDLYFTNPSTNFNESGFDVSDSTSNNYLIGEIQSVTTYSNSTIIVCSYNNGDPTPTQNSFIMFKKNKKINTSALKGYYSRVRFKNDTTSPAVMYSTTCRIIGSSK
tara:strand:+ start:5702 stop:6076 length:375 start_codon:yes stop_codon:yes gene_type:complete